MVSPSFPKQPRARLPSSSSSSLLLLLLVSFLLLLLVAPTSTSALGHSYPRRHPYQPRLASSLLSSSSLASRVEKGGSPRPTPEPPLGGLANLLATYKESPHTLLVKRDATTCFGTGTTVDEINLYFATKKTTAGTLFFCPGAVINVDATILFTASNQGLQTLGGTAVALENRATLKITNAAISTAIMGSGCRNCNNLLIDSLIIDGGRLELGSQASGAGLLEMGGRAIGHVITNNKVSNTRGWSSIHVVQGACLGAVISYNVVGPAGDSYGTGGGIADGISLACEASLVQNNELFDVSDGAIVIFSAPGSTISGNTITANTVVMLGGINMVDNGPYNGNYTGTQVYGNTIIAEGAQIKIGIAQGAANWGDSTTLVNFGGSVYGNTFGGTHLTFGLSLAGVSDWKTTGNIALDDTLFRGVKGANCHGLGGTVAPTFALIDPYKTSNVDLGADTNCWTQGTLQYLLCYLADPTNAGTSPDAAFVPGGVCEASAAVAAGTSNWKDSGYCLLDSATRILGGYWTNTASNSVELCSLRCSSLQYTYAGLENGKQCYCGNEILTSSGQGTVRTAASCGSVCPGNANEKCGGNGYNMNLWYDSSRVSAPVAPFLAASATGTSTPSPSSTLSSSAVASNLANVKVAATSASSAVSSSVVSSIITSSASPSSSSSTKVSSIVATPSSSSIGTPSLVVASIKSSSSSSAQISSVVTSSKSTQIPSTTSSIKTNLVVAIPSSSSSSPIHSSSVVASVKSSSSSPASSASSSRSSSAITSSKPTTVSSSSSSTQSSSVVAKSSSSSSSPSSSSKVSSVGTTSVVSSKTSSSSSTTPSSSAVTSIKTSVVTSVKSSSSSSSAVTSSKSSSSSSSSSSKTSTSVLTSTKLSSSATLISSTHSSSGSSSVKSSVSSKASSSSSSSTSSIYSTTVITSIIPRSTQEASPAAYANGYDGPICAKDGAVRVLQDYAFTSSSMTITLCTSTCKSKSYAWAALEYASQCLCGNTLFPSGVALTTVDSSKCATNCAGDSTSKCGGFYLMSLYSLPGLLASVSASSVSILASPTSSTAPLPVASTSPAYTNGYTSQGCMADVHDYVLQGYAFTSPAMTISLCTSTCKSRSFSFSALEYMSQCRCGNSLVTAGGGGAMLASSKCLMPCSGDASSYCGGYYAMSLYSSSEVLSSSIASAAKSASASGTSTASAAVASSTGWTTGLCVTDDAARLLTGASKTSAGMTPQICQDFCSKYAYAGTEYSTQCYCGNEDTVTATHGKSPASCTSKCGGDSSQICGGSYAMTLYTKLTGSWSTPECVTDGATRLLSASSFESSLMTNALCTSTCSNRGYIYAATEFGTQCYCGDFLTTSSIVGLHSTGCSTRCAGDSSEFCGGIYQASLSVFS